MRGLNLLWERPFELLLTLGNWCNSFRVPCPTDPKDNEWHIEAVGFHVIASRATSFTLSCFPTFPTFYPWLVS